MRRGLITINFNEHDYLSSGLYCKCKTLPGIDNLLVAQQSSEATAILVHVQQIQAPLQQTGCLKNHLVHAV